jgi:hypothetical protein
MPTSTITPDVSREKSRRKFMLVTKDGDAVPAKIPLDYSVGEAKCVLGDRAGFDPVIVGEGANGMSLRLAVEVERGGLTLLGDETLFRDLQQGARLHVIPSLAPA